MHDIGICLLRSTTRPFECGGCGGTMCHPKWILIKDSISYGFFGYLCFSLSTHYIDICLYGKICPFEFMGGHVPYRMDLDKRSQSLRVKNMYLFEVILLLI